MTNANDNAQIDLIKAQTKQAEITTLINIAATLDRETIVKNICDVMDIDYEEIKDKLPVDEEAILKNAENILSDE